MVRNLIFNMSTVCIKDIEENKKAYDEFLCKNLNRDDAKYSFLVKDFKLYKENGNNKFYWDFFKDFFCSMNMKGEVINKIVLLKLILEIILSHQSLIVNITSEHVLALKKLVNKNEKIISIYKSINDQEEKRKRQIKKATEQSAIARGRYKKQAEDIWVKNELWKYNTEYALRYYEDMIKQKRIYSNNGEDEKTIRRKSIDKLKKSWFSSFRKKYNKTNN